MIIVKLKLNLYTELSFYRYQQSQPTQDIMNDVNVKLNHSAL